MKSEWWSEFTRPYCFCLSVSTEVHQSLSLGDCSTSKECNTQQQKVESLNIFQGLEDEKKDSAAQPLSLCIDGTKKVRGSVNEFPVCMSYLHRLRYSTVSAQPMVKGRIAQHEEGRKYPTPFFPHENLGEGTLPGTMDKVEHISFLCPIVCTNYPSCHFGVSPQLGFETRHKTGLRNKIEQEFARENRYGKSLSTFPLGPPILPKKSSFCFHLGVNLANRLQARSMPNPIPCSRPEKPG